MKVSASYLKFQCCKIHLQ